MPEASPESTVAAAPVAPDARVIEPVLPSQAGAKTSRTTLLFIALAAVSLLISGSLWLKLSSIQEALARQSADATAASVEGRTLAKSASDAVKDIASRQALQETLSSKS
jgi:uroporphyrin-III C-methyltransferase